MGNIIPVQCLVPGDSATCVLVMGAAAWVSTVTLDNNALVHVLDWDGQEATLRRRLVNGKMVVVNSLSSRQCLLEGFLRELNTMWICLFSESHAMPHPFRTLRKKSVHLKTPAKESLQVDTQIEVETKEGFGIKTAPYPGVNTFLEDTTNDNLKVPSFQVSFKVSETMPIVGESTRLTSVIFQYSKDLGRRSVDNCGRMGWGSHFAAAPAGLWAGLSQRALCSLLTWSGCAERDRRKALTATLSELQGVLARCTIGSLRFYCREPIFPPRVLLQREPIFPPQVLLQREPIFPPPCKLSKGLASEKPVYFFHQDELKQN
ncbi:hypothetical protein ACRRTK_021085 [Alexandromys fortis]